jgi:hypothetical protein
MALRILGRGNCADDIAEMSYGCESSINLFFKTFVTEFVKNFYDDFVFIPTGDRLQLVLDSYAACGIPGGMGSMNCTHIG